MKTGFITWLIVIILFLYPPSAAFASGCLARGAVPGELYVYGVGGYYPYWVDWLYRSTDYGQTVYLQNDGVAISLLTEGAESGELYKTFISYGYMCYSDDFGVSFIQKGILGSDNYALASGYTPGEIYAIVDSLKYSSDYGETYITKEAPGPVNCMSVGHNPGEIYCGCDNGKVYHSLDYGETFERIVAIPKVIWHISRGCAEGEIYFFASDNKIYYSPNRGDSLYQQHYFDINPDYLTGIAGGFLSGEIYVLESRHYFTGGGDLYIHHSTDYGETFTKYHVYSAQEDIIPPQAITDLTCVPSDSSIFLEWSPVTTDIWGRYEMVDHHVVYRNIAPDFVPSEEDSIGFSTTYSYIDSCARWASPTYYYVVKVVDDSGNKSGSSNIVGKMNVPLVNEITFSSGQEKLKISSSVCFGPDNHSGNLVFWNLHSIGGVAR